jgi:hypothetical protein
MIPKALERWWLAIALAVATVLMAPGLLARIDIESRNQVYEISVPGVDVEEIAESAIGRDAAYASLADAGVVSIAIEMKTVGDLELDGRVAVMGRAQLLSQLAFAGIDDSVVPEGGGWFLTAPDGLDRLADALVGGHPPRTITPFEIDGQPYLHVVGASDIREVVVGYDLDEARQMVEHGFDLIARVPDTVDADPDVTGDELSALHDEFGVDRVLFTGSRAPYVDDPAAMDRLIERLREDAYSVMLIELLEQIGTSSYVERVGSGIRLHSIEMDQVPDETTASDRAIRAVEERNIRSVFLRPRLILEPEAKLQQISLVSEGTVAGIAGRFELGPARPFDSLETTPLLLAGAALASVAIAVASGALVAWWAALVMGVGTSLLVAGWLAGVGFAGDLLRLGIAVLASVLAVFIARPRERLGQATFQYGVAAALVFAGGLTITALGYEDRFLVGSTDFWGVKALLVAPLALTGLWAAYRSLDSPRLGDVPRVARLPVELWMALAAGVAGAALLYLLLRSGNTGTALDFELELRQLLEDVFVVRPRTKEFLIGFPALIAGIIVTSRTRHGWWLYAVASIGTASAIDSFSHFHTPLVVSLLRTAYAVGLGYLIGVVVVLFVRWAWPPTRDFALRHWG